MTLPVAVDDDEGAVSDVSEDEALTCTIRSESNAGSAESVAMAKCATRAAAALDEDATRGTASASIDTGRSSGESAAER